MTDPNARASRDLEKREILVVAPDDIRRARLSRSIRRAGARVTAAANGHEAASLACLGVYEAVVISMRLPDMTGAELARSVKGLSPWTRAIELTEAWTAIVESAEAGDGGTGAWEPATEEWIVTAIRDALTPAGVK